MNVAHIITPKGITLFIETRHHTIAPTHPSYNAILRRLDAGQYEGIEDLLDAQKAVASVITDLGDGFSVEGALIVLNGSPFSEAVSEKVLRMKASEVNVEPIKKFLAKVRENPSATAQRELLLFCEANGFAIHTDGDIIAFKGVRENFLDIYSGTISNNIGAIIAMPRWQVDDDRTKTCSRGLHFAALEYATTWSHAIGHVMVMKINPRDVVSIPNDYANQKGRCCRYEVIAELEGRAPLAHREAYSDSDLGVEVVPAKTLREEVKERVFTVVAQYTIVDPFTADSTLDDLDLSRSEREEMLEALREEFEEATLTLELGSFTTVSGIVDHIVAGIANEDDLSDLDGDDEEEDDFGR